MLSDLTLWALIILFLFIVYGGRPGVAKPRVSRPPKKPKPQLNEQPKKLKNQN